MYRLTWLAGRESSKCKHPSRCQQKTTNREVSSVDWSALLRNRNSTTSARRRTQACHETSPEQQSADLAGHQQVTAACAWAKRGALNCHT